MITKTSSRIVKVLTVVAATLALSACSGSQQDEEELDAEQGENQQANLGEDDAAQGNGQENYGDNEGGNQQYQQDGAEVNNATEEEDTNDTADINPTLDGSAGNPTAAPDPAAAQAVPVAEPAPAAPVAAAQAAPTAESPVPGGRVRYVKEGGIQVMNSPGGTPVLTLEQGDHPVTWEENGWLRITNGMYVPVDGMSDKGIPRSASGAGFAH